MSADLPLAAPRRGLTGQAAGHVWQWGFPLWDGYFALAFAVTVGAILAGRDGTTAGRTVAVVAMVGCAAWYVAYGRPLMRADDESWRGVLYCAVAGVFLVVALVFSPAASLALLFLIPQAYWCQSTGPAAGAVVGYCVTVVLVDALKSGDAAGELAREGPLMLLLVVFAVVVGGWAHRIIRQSRDRARLIEELDDTRAQLARVSHEAGISAERQRLAAEIHDTLAQGFSSIVMLVQAADSVLEALDATGADRPGTDPDRGAPRIEQARRHLARAVHTARENLAEARAMVGALQPVALEASSVSDAVRRLVGRFGEDRDRPASYTLHGEAVRLAPATEVVLLRTAQEALANVGKHAGPATVAVSLHYDESAVELSVRDDGPGFDPAHADGGYGLAGMRTRIEQIGGTCLINSRPGAGTTVTVQVPR